MEFSDSNIKKFLIFLGNGNPEKTSYIFSKESFSYISGNGNHKKKLYFRKQNFLCSKNEKNVLLKSFLYFGEMELSNHKLKKLFIFQKGTCKA